MSGEPVWLDAQLITAIQSEQIAVFGGASGLRDAPLLEASLDRPRNKWSYGESDLCVLAAAYAFALAKNHPFIDGNKRTAFLSIITFLGLNEVAFRASEPDAVVMMLGLASGHVGEEAFAEWIKNNSEFL